jgi:hypothetical protein
MMSEGEMKEQLIKQSSQNEDGLLETEFFIALPESE